MQEQMFKHVGLSQFRTRTPPPPNFDTNSNTSHGRARTFKWRPCFQEVPAQTVQTCLRGFCEVRMVPFKCKQKNPPSTGLMGEHVSRGFLSLQTRKFRSIDMRGALGPSSCPPRGARLVPASGFQVVGNLFPFGGSLFSGVF